MNQYDLRCQFCGKGFEIVSPELAIAKDGEAFQIHRCVEYETDKTKPDNVNKPKHYQGTNGLEVFDVISGFAPTLENAGTYYWGNVVKYILRFHLKNGVEDLKKAQVYLDKLIENVEGKK